MFEGSLISLLRSDTGLAAFVSTYKTAPAIFSDVAPEDASLPFAETVIQENSVGDSVVASFTVLVDFYNSTESAVSARAFCQRVVELLDRQEINNDSRYHRIRFFINSGPYRVEEGDPRDVHYRVQFSARAGRKKFIDELAT
jgi:hypothetical protein